MHSILVTFNQFSDAFNESLKNSKYNSLQNKRNIIQIIRDKVVDFVMDFLSRIDISEDYSNITPFINIILAIIIVLIIILLFFVINRVLGKVQKNPVIREMLEDLGDATSSSLSDFITKGRSFALRGKFREAIRYHYIALLWILNKEDILSFNEVKTNGQILRELKEKNFLRIDLFSNIVEIVDTTWYGNKEICESAYESFINNFKTLSEGIKNG